MEIFRPFKIKCKFGILVKLTLGLLLFSLYFGLLLRESIHALKVGIHNRSTAEAAQLTRELKKIIRPPPTVGQRIVPAVLQAGQNEYEYSEDENAAAERDFQERKRVLMDECANLNLLNVYPPNAWEFFISPGSLTWCPVFKAASSMWLYYFNILAGYDVKYLQKTKTPQLELAKKRFPRPTFEELYETLSNSVSFLSVREPFERLLSAYRDKLEGGRKKYYEPLGSQIVKKFRDSANQTASKRKCKSGPTFKEFTLYLIHVYKSKANTKFDEHWAPVYTFCTPCSVNFTLIAKVETFQRDAEYIIRQAGLEELLLKKLPKKNSSIYNRSLHATNTVKSRYFSELDSKTLGQLLKIYEPDFQLFGYNSTPYFEIVKSH